MKLTNKTKSAKRNLSPITYHLSPGRIPIRLLFAIILILPSSSAAHWVAGYVENALDATSPNDRIVRLWNPLNSQEIFGTIGPNGLSSTSNVYMIDCEMLATPCNIGDKLNLTIVNDASGYTTKKIVEVTVSEAGFDMAENLSLNTPPTFISLTIEDTLTFPSNEIDLTPSSTTQANCFGVIQDYEGASSIQSIIATLFKSSAQDPDDNNFHYTNSTCNINTSYGTPIQAMINCSFQIEYYAEPGTWQCQINATDNYTSSKTSTDATNINTLLAIGVLSPMDFGKIDVEEVSQEATSQVTNYGNVEINLTLSGYGQTPGDGNAMECGAVDISVEYMKYNLTSSNSSNLTLQGFEAIYENLTTAPTTKEFNLNSRQDDLSNDAMSDTYWRVYAPDGITSSCTGNVVFGATQS